jgi:hypothetical protein
VTIKESTQVTSCNLLAPVHHTSSNSRSARMSFSRVFIVEHHLASRSYLTCQNEFRDTFPDSLLPNSKIWSAENPQTFHDKPLRSLKVAVCCAVSRRRIIGPIFFSETITAEHCQEFIMNVISVLKADERDSWFQQDGATAHTAISTMHTLSQFFDCRIISRNLWPPQFLDQSPPNLCLWGFWRRTCTKTRTH